MAFREKFLAGHGGQSRAGKLAVRIEPDMLKRLHAAHESLLISRRKEIKIRVFFYQF